MREMFDAIAPRYDLVNRVMTFRLDVRWRRRAVEALALPAGQPRCSTWPAAPATCASTSPPPAASRSRSTCQPRDAARRPQRRAAGAGRHPAPARGRRRRRRRHVRLRAAQPRRAAGVLRRARASRAPRRTHRPARRRRARATAWCALGHSIYFGKVVPRSRRVAVRPGGVPLPAPQRRLPAAARRDGGAAAARRVRRRDATACSRSASAQLLTGTAARLPDRPDAGRHSSRRRRDPRRSTSTTSPAATGSCSSATASASPGAASPPGSRSTTCRRCSAAIDHVDETGFDGARPGVGPVAPRLGAVRARAAPGEAVVPAVVVGKGADGSLLGHTIDGADEALAPPVAAAGPTADAYTIEPVTPIERLPRRRRRGPRRGARRSGSSRR